MRIAKQRREDPPVKKSDSLLNCRRSAEGYANPLREIHNRSGILFVNWRDARSKWVVLKVRGRAASESTQGVSPTVSCESDHSPV